jgi:hypothetical protein
MRDELRRLLIAALELPAEQMAGLLGEVEEFKCKAMVRLVMPAHPSGPDELLDIEEAARRLGTSKDYLYRHSRQFAFTRRMGRKLLFSALGIELYISERGRSRVNRKAQ